MRSRCDAREQRTSHTPHHHRLPLFSHLPLTPSLLAQLLEVFWSYEDNCDYYGDKLSYLHCLCGDAWMALGQPGRAIHQFAKLHSPLAPGAGPSRLILDAQLECVCAMLARQYPPSQIVLATQQDNGLGSASGFSAACLTASRDDGLLTGGWTLLARVLSEVSDAADSPLLLPFLPSLSHTLPPSPPFPPSGE